MTVQKTIENAAKDNRLTQSTLINLNHWLDTKELPGWVHDSLNELIKDGEWEELNDRFFKDISFGTGGMRGRTIGKIITLGETGETGSKTVPERPMVGSNALNDFTVIRATIALYEYTSNFLKENGRFETPCVAIAHDVRYFSRRFCLLSASTWSKLGGIPLIFDGPRSTPQLSFTVRKRKAHAGIVITASHNPPHDNGFKVYFEDGAQVVHPHAHGIVENYVNGNLAQTVSFLDVSEEGIKILPQEDDLAYLKVVEQAALDPNIIERESPKVVFTPIHGTGAISTVPVLWELGLNPILEDEQSKQDPQFPTVESPNPENAEALKKGITLARKTGAVAVLATDPDSDRMGVAILSEKRKVELLNGNVIGALLAEYRLSKLKEYGVIPENGTNQAAIIKTYVTSPLVERIAEGHGVKCINTLTGFKWTGQKIKSYESKLKNAFLENECIALNYDETDYFTRLELAMKYSTAFIFACEESYGYLPYDFVRDKDGNASCVAFCELLAHLKKENTTISKYLDAIYVKYGYHDQNTVNIYYDGASGAEKIKRIVDSYSNSPPKSIGNVKVISHKDFNRGGIKDADREEVPTEVFHFFTLENQSTFAVRASGTEPKLKYYVFANKSIDNNNELTSAKIEVKKNIEIINDNLKAELKERENT